MPCRRPTESARAEPDTYLARLQGALTRANPRKTRASSEGFVVPSARIPARGGTCRDSPVPPRVVNRHKAPTTPAGRIWSIAGRSNVSAPQLMHVGRSVLVLFEFEPPFRSACTTGFASMPGHAATIRTG